jgi:sulfatase maturation enzyme AslB (radical SAM superfamily)
LTGVGEKHGKNCYALIKGQNIPMIKPTKIRLDASSACQLRCVSCMNAMGETHSTIGVGFLKMADFQRLIQENPHITEVELSNWGEIFLNPQILEIMAYAYERKVTLTADNGVNLNNVKENVLEGLVKYKFKSMTCSIDGASNETYTIYRVKGNFDTVIDNLRKIKVYKEKYQSEYPILKWQFIIFGHNEHEITMARKLAHELGMVFYPKLSWDPDFAPVVNIENIKKEIGASSRNEFTKKTGTHYMQAVCHQLWDQPQINWDGKLLGCCYQYWGDFGANVFRDGLSKSLNNDKMTYARGMLLGRKPARVDMPCTACDVYRTMETNGNWLRRGLISRLVRAAWPVRKTL